MKRKIIPFLLALALLLSMCVSASAANTYCRRTCTVQNGRIVCRNVCYGSRTTTCSAVPTVTKPSAVSASKPTASASEAAASDFEKAVCDLVNAERAKYGLAPLTLRNDLCSGARAKSQDMQSNKYFAHQSPTYGSPFDMMKRFGISYFYAGENIAYGYATPEAVMRAWMNSEGHRANILNGSFTAIGVGYVASGNYWTQWFVG